jgi:hypothetical protein
MSQMARSAATTPGAGESPLGAMMRGQVGKMDPDALRRFQQAIQSGQRDQAIQQLSSTMGVDPARASTIVDQALILSGKPANASPEARATAETAVKGAGAAAWVVFAAVALALAIGVAGGALGARGSRRVSWSGSPAAARVP